MDILIPDSWLREFLETNAAYGKIAQCLSLSSQSVKRTMPVGKDWIYEIEVTTNRPDCLSILGLARELAAILPREGIEARFKPPPTYHHWASKGGLNLEVKITDPSLCPRFTAVVFDEVKIKPSAEIIKERLAKVGIRALNNVVDISNYLMVELGQPMHTFDYDKIGKAKMILREAKAGEKIVTLDGQKRVLPKGAIIIEDGRGQIIDLCGIMGGENSAVSQETKRVLLFVQTYDPKKIRQTCQALAFRTEAAARFEKGVNPEGVLPAVGKAIEMFEKECQAKIASSIIDIYPKPAKKRTIELDFNQVERIIGIDIPQEVATAILESLGFRQQSSQIFSVPPWRLGDVSIQEDLIEEIARIYGYHNLPSIIPPGQGESPRETRFFWEEKIKTAFKYWGFTEVISYSMVSKDLLEKTQFSSENCLKISNPLTAGLVYMRPSLIPSLLQIISQNQPHSPKMDIFEIANIYLPQGQSRLPKELPHLAAVQSGKSLLEVKGILEALFKDLGIKNYRIAKSDSPPLIFETAKTGEIYLKNKSIGYLGEIKKKIIDSLLITSPVIVFDLDFNSLVANANQIKKYQPVPSFPPIVEDMAFIIQQRSPVGKIMEEIRRTDKLITKVELLDSYNNTRTFRLTYQSDRKSLADREVKPIREKIIARLQRKYGAHLKESGRGLVKEEALKTASD